MRSSSSVTSSAESNRAAIPMVRITRSPARNSGHAMSWSYCGPAPGGKPATISSTSATSSWSSASCGAWLRRSCSLARAARATSGQFHDQLERARVRVAADEVAADHPRSHEGYRGRVRVDDVVVAIDDHGRIRLMRAEQSIDRGAKGGKRFRVERRLRISRRQPRRLEQIVARAQRRAEHITQASHHLATTTGPPRSRETTGAAQSWRPLSRARVGSEATQATPVTQPDAKRAQRSRR